MPAIENSFWNTHFQRNSPGLEHRNFRNGLSSPSKQLKLTFAKPSETAGSHHQTREFDGALFAGGGGTGHSAQSSRAAQEVRPAHDAARAQDRQGSDGAETGRCSLLDVAQGMELRAVKKFGSHAGQLGTGDGVQSNTE